MNSDPEVFEKEIKVVNLRRLGMTFESIAKQVGYTNAGGAYKAFQRGMKEIIVEDVEEIRQIELDRLDIAQNAIMGAVLKGRIPAINTMLKLSERRARLLGLDAPVKHEMEVNYYERDAIDAEFAELTAVWNSHKAGTLAIESGATRATTEEGQ